MREELTSLLADLVGIDSQNPVLVPGAPGEEELARYVARWLEAAGFEVELEEAAPRRPNVIGVARGSGGGQTLMLNAHMDTVGEGGMERALEPRVENGRLYGRGAYDMKGSLAAILVAARDAAATRLAGDVVVTAVADEEAASIGTAAVAAARGADGAIVAEPTELQVAVAHRGFVAFEVETIGRAAHGSRPELGIDAVAHMGFVLVGLHALDRSLRAEPRHRLLRSGSLHAGVIEGGVEFSTYPDRCLLTGERRTIPGETTDAVLREVVELLERAGRGVEDFEGSVQASIARDPFEVPEDDPIVELVRRHAGATGVVGVPFWTDAALLASAGIPTVVFGPAGEGAHADVEWVDLASVGRCAEILTAVTR
ncbi:MAG TPA: M20/M25/M40 family metallo-hydrolase, partial [Gaiellaceae bacterium]|nr:M20/M25/M40 family metallo-hydrolase [Gaiellaceae bacterium]